MRLTKYKLKIFSFVIMLQIIATTKKKLKFSNNVHRKKLERSRL